MLTIPKKQDIVVLQVKSVKQSTAKSVLVHCLNDEQFFIPLSQFSGVIKSKQRNIYLIMFKYWILEGILNNHPSLEEYIFSDDAYISTGIRDIL